jgi:hypothetical protein
MQVASRECRGKIEKYLIVERMSSTSVSKRMNAPRAVVYRALLDARAIATWMGRLAWAFTSTAKILSVFLHVFRKVFQVRRPIDFA